MTHTPISLLLLRRLTLATQYPKPPPLLCCLSFKPYSSSTSSPTSSPDPPKPTSLSARMSFVFDQIDAIQRDRAEKDQTLQRIRDWRQSRTTLQQQQYSETTLETGQSRSPEAETSQNETLEPESHLAETGPVVLEVKKQVEMVHPWPEWLELMERLVQQNYFDHKRKDEDRFAVKLGLDMHNIGDDDEDDDDFAGADDVGIDFKDIKTVHSACVNFGKDRFDIMRSLSRQDIQVLVGYGCPSSDRKVVFSCKLLRKYAHLDEGDVCSNCSLRSSCEKAYLVTNKEDEARTVDVMRVLLSYAFDPINGSVVNKSILKQKSVKTVVRKLLHQVVKLSAVPIDPNLPRPVFKKPPPKVKQPPPPPKKRVGRDDVEMKKGDWLCPKCDFMNFAKNTVCLQCDAKRPKRQLLPGEWECPQCNFLNYRRNMACFHCDCKRPADEFSENKTEAKQYGHRADRTVLEKVLSHKEVSYAWNFNFDDNESDGADVSAFENADSETRSEDSHLGRQDGAQNFSRHEDGFNAGSRRSRVRDREYPEPDHDRFGRGFDDFDDEDDVHSYEVDTQSNSLAGRTSRKNFSEVENSESEDIEDFDGSMRNHVPTGFSSNDKPSDRKHRKAAFSDFEDKLDPDLDENNSAHPKWKSSNIAGVKHRGRGRNPMTFELDEELDSVSEVDIDSRRKQGKWVSRRRDLHKNSYQEDSLFSGSESESDSIDLWGKRSGVNRMEHNRRSDNFRGHGDYGFVQDSDVSSRSKMRDISGGSRGKNRGFRANDVTGRGNRSVNRMEHNRRSDNFRGHGDYEFLQDSDASSRRKMHDTFGGSRGKSRGFQAGRRMNDRDRWNNSKEPKEERFHKSFGRKSREFNMDRDMDPGEFRNRRRVIERTQ